MWHRNDVEDAAIQNELLILLVAICTTQYSAHLQNLQGKDKLDVKSRVSRAMK